MTRRLQNQPADDSRSRKRILKPAVEKKRRDRINKSLAELRALLLRYTSDPRLQNPKIEKAEILDLTVEHLQMLTDGRSSGAVGLHPSESGPSAPPSMENAGFQQCVAQLAAYVHKISPAQRSSLMEGLKLHMAAGHNWGESSDQGAFSGDAVCTSEGKEESRRFPSHASPQPPFCSTPCHDTLTPPTSPWFSPSFSTYGSSPPFPSLACHFSFPPSLSPPSANTSFSTLPQPPHGLHAPVKFSPAVAAAPHFPLRPPPHPAQREGSSAAPCMWRPWF